MTSEVHRRLAADFIESAIKGFDDNLKKSICLPNDRAQRGHSMRIFLICCVGEQNGENFPSANSLCKWIFKKSVVGQETSQKCADGVIRLRIEQRLIENIKLIFNAYLQNRDFFNFLTAGGRLLEKGAVKTHITTWSRGAAVRAAQE